MCYNVRPLQSISNSNFGPLIAYLVPGATALWGCSQFSPVLKSWFASSPGNLPTIGGFLYLTFASVAAGMIVSAVRWAGVDSIHRISGLKPPRLDFSSLPGKVDAFNLLIEIHYRHYQFYANMFVATFFAYLCFRISPDSAGVTVLVDIGFVGLETVFFLTSRDTLCKYYTRTAQLLNTMD